MTSNYYSINYSYKSKDVKLNIRRKFSSTSHLSLFFFLKRNLYFSSLNFHFFFFFKKKVERVWSITIKITVMKKRASNSTTMLMGLILFVLMIIVLRQNQYFFNSRSRDSFIISTPHAISRHNYNHEGMLLLSH